MAQALLIPLQGFITKQYNDIRVFTPTKVKATKLAAHFQATVVNQIVELNDCDAIVLAHKPQNIKEVSQRLHFSQNPMIISMLASIEIRQIEGAFGVTRVLRLMPNTAAQVGKGVVTCFSKKSVSHEFAPWLSALASHSKLLEFSQEEMIDLTTAELGSGPGIVLELVRIFSESLIKKGVERSIAHDLTAQVFRGSAELVSQTREDPAVLRDQVTSKGGITEECLKLLRKQSLENIFQDSFKAGYNRSKELKN